VNAAAPATNSASEAIRSLFGDPVVVKGKGFEIKKSEVDDLFAAWTAQRRMAKCCRRNSRSRRRSAHDHPVVAPKATAADRALGQQNADTQFTNSLEKIP
jgi:hypothetical protein